LSGIHIQWIDAGFRRADARVELDNASIDGRLASGGLGRSIWAGGCAVVTATAIETKAGEKQSEA
jgi:hypothetical protein